MVVDRCIHKLPLKQPSTNLLYMHSSAQNLLGNELPPVLEIVLSFLARCTHQVNIVVGNKFN